VEAEQVTDNRRPLSAGALVAIVIVAMATVALRDRAWWVIPPVAFAVSLAFMRLDGRQPLTAGWVLFAAALAIALGVFLRFF
jgi:hypothetical protein